MSKTEEIGSAGIPKAAFNLHVEKTEKRLKHWRFELDKFAQTALSIQVNQKAAFDKKVIDLQAKLDLAQIKFEALRSAGGHKFEALKDALEHSVSELERAFKA